MDILRESTVTVRDDTIVVRSPFYMKELLKSVPGARWDKERKAWTYPASGLSAATLEERLPPVIERDAVFVELAEAGVADAAAGEVIRHSETLDDVPLTLRPAWTHQRQAYWFAQGKPGAMLAMDMGTGKSKVALDLVQNSGDRLVLIVCPSSVVDVWPLEVERNIANPRDWQALPLRKGSVKRRADELKQAVDLARMRGTGLIVVVNYEAAWRAELGKALLATEWDTVIADEIHRIKSPNGKASKFMTSLGAKVPRRLGLTGTPAPHSPMDIYAQYRFLDVSVFGTSFYGYRNDYAVMGGYLGKQVLRFKNEAELNRLFYSIGFRVMAEDVLDLPPQQHMERYCDLEPAAQRMYANLRDEFVAWLADGTEVTAPNVLVKLLRMQQMTSGHLPNPETEILEQVSAAKSALLADTLDGLAVDEPVVVFGRFQADLDTIHEIAAAQGRASVELSGRVNELAAWQAGDAPVLAVQIQAGGVGIDLTRARYCVYYSVGYSLGDYQQSLARVHRPGQTRPVFYYHLMARGTVDEAVMRALRHRKEVVESLLAEIKTEGRATDG